MLGAAGTRAGSACRIVATAAPVHCHGDANGSVHLVNKKNNPWSAQLEQQRAKCLVANGIGHRGHCGQSASPWKLRLVILVSESDHGNIAIAM